MDRKIMVPLDGSALAESVLPHAMALATATHCSILLVRVVPQAGLTGWHAVVAPEIQEQRTQDEIVAAKGYLSEQVRRIEAVGIVAHCEVIREEDAAMAIVMRTNRDSHIAMIAMATHGLGGTGRWLYGSVAEKVLRGSPVPLLLIRPAEGEQRPEKVEYRKLLVPLDGSMFAEQALVLAEQIACDTGAEILLTTALKVDSPVAGERQGQGAWLMPDDPVADERIANHLRHTAEQLEARGVRSRMVVTAGDPALEILRLAHEEQVDLVVMSTHGRSGLQRLWIGSIATKVMQGAHRPVLLVRAWEPHNHQPRQHLP